MKSLKDLLAQIQIPLNPKSLWRPRTISFALSALLIFGGGKFLFDYLNEPLPTISLQTPKENEEILTDDLYLRGTVHPLGSKVLVNGQSVSLNGDGTFTAVLQIKEGKNTLQVTAENKGKKAEFLRLVNRKLSPAEDQAKKETEAKELAETRARILSQNQEISQVQSAYTQRDAKKVRVINHELKDDYGLKRVAGEVVNDTESAAYWVKVTANFLDEQGRTVEIKLSFITSFEKFLKPGETASFETQSIEKDFDHYQLDVTWEKE